MIIRPYAVSRCERGYLAPLLLRKCGMTSFPNFSMEAITFSWGMVSVCMISMT